MPRLDDQIIRLAAGADLSTGLQLPTVVRDDPARLRVEYVYTYLTYPARSATNALPTGITSGPNNALNIVRGRVPATYGYTETYCVATVDEFSEQDDPDAPYEARYTFIVEALAAVPDQLSAGFNALEFRDSDRYRIGIAHDNPSNMYLFMSLPEYAIANQGPINQGGGGNTGLMWLPIENIQEFIPPRITSNRIESMVYDGPYITEDVPANVRPTVARANYRSIVQYGAASLRLLWKESYASHGGPYGLYQASINGSLRLTWAYYRRDPETPTNGRVVRLWTGYVAEFIETLNRQGRFVDIVIMPSASIRSQRVAPATGIENVASIVWPQTQSPGMGGGGEE